MQTPSTIDGTQAVETRVNYVLQLKTTLESLPHIVAALENVQSFLLCKAKKVALDNRNSRKYSPTNIVRRLKGFIYFLVSSRS